MKMRWSLTLFVPLVILAALQGSDWTSFRNGNGGVAEDLPTSADNILWKAKLPGPGSSSPITLGDRLFVTCYTGYGTKLTKGMGGGGGKGGGGFKKGDGGKGGGGDAADEAEQKNLKLVLLCLDRNTGDIRWKKEIAPKLPEASFTGFMREHGYATSTPTTDGQHVYAFFGKSGVYAFDLEGNQIWQADVGSKTDGWGSGASPVLANNLLLVNAAIESGELIAFDKLTGKELWRSKSFGKNWSTPVVAKSKEGREEIILSVPGKILGINPKDGKTLWYCNGIGEGGRGYTSSTPVVKNSIAYTMGGGGPTPVVAIAVRLGGSGDVNDSHVVWRKGTGTGISSPILVDDQICWIAGNLVSLNQADGSEVTKERLYDGKGEYTSPILAGDKIYAITRLNGLYVLSSKGKFEQLAHHDFKGDDSTFNASPAVSNGKLYIRSNEYLYCIGQK